jgi:hypothetical protein
VRAQIRPLSGHQGRPNTNGPSAHHGPAEALLGKPRRARENPAPAHGRLQHLRTAQERGHDGGCVPTFEEENDLLLADEDVVTLEPDGLDLERRPSSTSWREAS